MKVIKLSIIFLVFVGGLILALNWESIFKPSNDDDDNFQQKDLIDISAKCEEIRSAWERSLGWNEALYKSIREDIDQSKSMGMFSREGYNTVNNTLRESATNKACDGYLAALHNNTFSDAKLQENYKGVQSIKTYENLNGDLRIKDVEDRHKLYGNIKRFVNSSHAISPQFDTEKVDWVSFASSENKILSTARSYRQNKLYIEEMTHIPHFKSGLDESNLKKTTSEQRSSFYNRLCTQIIVYFQNGIKKETERPTPEMVNLLNQIYNKYTDQESYYGVKELATFKVNYGEED